MNTARPTENDEDVIELAVDRLLPKVLRWLGKDATDPAGTREDLKHHIDCLDGYEFAKALEWQNHWSVDAELVEILDGWHLHEAVSELTPKWVESFGVYPLKRVGEHVAWKGFPCEITGIDLKRGTYTLFSPQEGHVRKGLGSHGHLVAWELIDGAVNCRGLTITGPLLEAVHAQ